MVARATTGLERLLLERVERELGLPAGAAVGDALALATLRNALDAAELTADESERTRERQEERAPGETLSDILLSVRLERALAAASDVVARGAGIAAPPVSPRVLVLRDEGIDGPATTSQGFGTLTRTFSSDRAPRSLFVLAEGRARARFESEGLEPMRETIQARRVSERSQRLRDAVDAVEAVEVHDLPSAVEEVAQRLSELPLAAAAVAAPAAPERFGGKYRVVRELGRGGFGAVYEAEDVALGHRVAIKVLHGQARLRPAELAAFKDEARRLTRLSHPNIVDWKSFEESADGACWFVMELLPGEDLETTLRREKRIEPARALRLLHQVLAALRAAHRPKSGEAILHLDLKPKNVFLVPDPHAPGGERVKIIDFGIGQIAGGGAQRTTSCTPEYASPEQCAHLLPGAEIVALDARSDLYSFGVMAFQVLSGELPFTAPKRRLDWLDLHRTTPPRTLAAAGVRAPRPFARFVERCLVKERDARWRDTEQAWEALERIVHPPVWKRVAPVALPLLLVALVTVGWLWQRLLAKRPFPLLDAQGAVLAGNLVTLGPQRPSVRVKGAAFAPEAGSVVEITPVDGVTDVAWLSGRVAPDGSLEVTANVAVAPPGRAKPRIELAAGGATGTRISEAFDLLWLGPDAFRVASVQIPELEGRALDPRGARIDVVVEGDGRDDLVVRVAAGGREGDAAPDPTFAGTSARRYVLALDDLLARRGRASAGASPGAAADGPALATLSIEVVDFAGRRVSRRFPEQGELALVHEPLALQRARLDTVNLGDRFAVTPNVTPKLLIALTHPARVSWRVVGLDGDELQPWRVAAGGSPFAVELPELATLKHGQGYRGFVELAADDAEFVRHGSDVGRGRANARVPFEFGTRAPEFTLRLADAARAVPQPFDGELCAFTRERTAQLVIERSNDVPVRLVVEPLADASAADGAESGASRATTLDLADPAQLQGRFDLALPEAGELAVRVRAFRLDSTAGASGAEPDVDRTLRVVVDRSAPTLRVAGVPADFVVRESAATATAAAEPDRPLPPFELTIEDGAATATPAEGAATTPATPVALRWTLVRLVGAREEITPVDGLPASARPGEPLPITLPEPWRARPDASDGRWLLRVEGRDAAGNVAIAGELAWRVALRGPALAIEKPSKIGAWSPDPASGRFTLLVRASDPNGIAAVTGAVAFVPDPTQPQVIARVPIEFVRDDASREEEAVWRGRIERLPSEWSERSVALELAARDRDGAASQLPPETRALGQVERRLPAGIARVVEAGGERLVVRMRLVRGNAGRYVFGGQVEAEENRRFRQRNQLYHDAEAPSESWQIELPPRRIGDYYLDEQETTGAPFLAFLGSDAARAALGEARCATLVAQCEGAAELPVTGITWDEARAFAGFTGRRLPTLVEWEYALRGGSEYRVTTVGEPPSAAGPSAPGIGEDRTPEQLADLAANVAEWTETPVWFEPRASRFDTPLAQARRHADLLALPWAARAGAPATHFWVAGGSFQSSRHDFAAVEPRRRDASSAAIGLRCALSGDVVERALEAGAAGGLVVVEE